MRKIRLLLTLLLPFLLLPYAGYAQSVPDVEVKQHFIFGYLGEQHVGNVVFRRTNDGGRFVAWGRVPLLEWPLGSARHRQVVPDNPHHRFANGGCAFDVDRDGEDEVVVARGYMPDHTDTKIYWFNDVEGQDHWEVYYIADAGVPQSAAPHDIQPFALRLPSGDEARGIIGSVGRRDLYFFEIPDDPTRPWTRYHIGPFPDPIQSGMEIVDVNGDGRPDIVSGMFWVETPADPRQEGWVFHRFGTWDQDNPRWGGMIKHGVADFDGDGYVDIVTAEAEIPGARLGLWERHDEHGEGLWTLTLLDRNLYAPHSLVVGDLNRDGRQDFIVGEMSAGGWDYPLNPSPKIYAYLNQDGLQFDRSVLVEGWGVHEMHIIPEGPGGDMLIYGADEIQPQKFDGMRTHLSYWTVGPVSRHDSD